MRWLPARDAESADDRWNQRAELAVGVNYLHGRKARKGLRRNPRSRRTCNPLPADVGNCTWQAMFNEFSIASDPSIYWSPRRIKQSSIRKVTEEQWLELTFSDWKGALPERSTPRVTWWQIKSKASSPTFPPTMWTAVAAGQHLVRRKRL